MSRQWRELGAQLPLFTGPPPGIVPKAERQWRASVDETDNYVSAGVL